MSKITFISTVPGLESIEECLPKPAKHFIPKWFKDMPATGLNLSTVKVCPSFPDYFSLGYIVPMWTDTKLSHKPGTTDWFWETAAPDFSWNMHGRGQLIDHTQVRFNGSESEFVFKAECPWRMITPKGWSVLQLPLFYHFNKEYSVLPGVIDTDIHHEINQQVLYHGNGEPVQINRGDPFVLYVPFKRDNKLNLNIRYQTEKDIKLFRNKNLDIMSKFVPNGTYRKWQRQRDK
jgi:hypothetical protein